MADIVVVTHLVPGHGLPEEQLNIALQKLTKAVHANTDDVGVKIGDPSNDVTNTIIFKTPLNKKTAEDLEQALEFLFGEDFKVKGVGEMHGLEREGAIDYTAKQLKNQFKS